MYVVAVDRDPAAPGFRFADRRAIVSVEDENAVNRLAAAEHVHGIIAPGIDFPVGLAARVAARHNLPHPLSPEVAQAAVSKLRQREGLAEAGVPHAPFRVCTSAGDAERAAAELGLPCVIKPPDRQGQRGLTVVTHVEDVAGAFEEALAAARGQIVLVEKLVAGPELTVNAFSVGGDFYPLTVTDRVVAAPPAFGVALAHVWPSESGGEVVDAATELARAAAKAVGVQDGPTYTQVLVGEDGPVVGELAARLGGGHDAELCEAALGVDLNGLAIAAALGEEIPSDKLSLGSGDEGREVGGACVRFLVAPEGSVKAVDGVERAGTSDGVAWVRVYRRPGDEIRQLRQGSDRAGAVLAVGESRKQALARARRAARRVRFRVVETRSPVEIA